MATSAIEAIINQTLRHSFGGRDIFEVLANSTNRRLPDDDGNTPSASLQDQLDSLAQQALQNVEMGQMERLVWILLFSVMVLVAAGGNTIVVYTVSTNKEMKSVTNYFLVNLSVADTMVSILNVVFNFISMLNR